MEGLNSIREILASTGFKIGKSSVWRDIPYIWADHLHGEPEKTFAKYLFTFTDAAYWSQWDKWGDSFISDVIEPMYFHLANDVSWNLYWISVLEESELCKIDAQQKIIFSSNTEYTRNLMISLEHLSTFIPVGKITMNSGTRTITQPSDDWIEMLDKKGLTFCLNPYSTKDLDSYIDGATASQRKSNSVSDVLNEHKLTILKSIEISKRFREHYYPKDWNIPFQHVNLLYGPNGSGKTSVLSAIELAMTGEIRGITTEKDPSTQAKVALAAEIDNNEQKLCPPGKAAEKKERARKFYSNRNNNRDAPQLQNLFHRFNYLSVEETFLFMREQPDFSDIFSKILYGSEESTMWTNLKRYKTVCERAIADYEKDLEKLDAEIKTLAADPSVDKDSLQDYLSASGLRFKLDASPEEILKEAQILLAEYDKVRGFAPILSQNELQKTRALKAESLRSIETQVKRLEEELNQAKAEETYLLSEKIKLKENSQEISKYLTSLQSLDPYVRQLQFYDNHEKAIIEYQRVLASKKSYEEKIVRLRKLIEEYSAILESPPSRSMEQIRKEMQKLHADLNTLNEKYDALRDEIDQEELAQEKRAALFSALSTTGLELYQLDSQRSVCPLCGTEGITEITLRRHLELESNQGSQKLQENYKSKLELEGRIREKSSKLKKLGQEETIAFNYANAMGVIQNNFPKVQFPSDLYQEHARTQSQLSDLRSLIKQSEESLLAGLKQENISSTIENILNSRHQLLSAIQYEPISLSLTGPNKTIIAAISDARSEWENQKRTYDDRFSSVQKALAQQKDKVTLCEKSFYLAREQSKELSDETLRLKRISDFWKAAETTVADHSLDGEAIQNLCHRICALAGSIIESMQNEGKKRELSVKFENITEKMHRYQIIQSTLETLRAPEDYADTFISQNISDISRIFLALHSPQEFSGLDIHEKELVAIRNKEKIPISHMSTGQRTALVIAVFFHMNLATPTAPNFLLLDEPVANIDDLNILALMDFLREIAITHNRQIFFTTANRNVAKLFRRKFSFLEEDFQELRFFREKEHHLRIERRIYDQNVLSKHQEL